WSNWGVRARSRNDMQGNPPGPDSRAFVLRRNIGAAVRTAMAMWGRKAAATLRRPAHHVANEQDAADRDPDAYEPQQHQARIGKHALEVDRRQDDDRGKRAQAGKQQDDSDQDQQHGQCATALTAARRRRLDPWIAHHTCLWLRRWACQSSRAPANEISRQTPQNTSAS